MVVYIRGDCKLKCVMQVKKKILTLQTHFNYEQFF